LKAEEFWVNQCIFVSATPGDWELEISRSGCAAGDSTDWVVDPELCASHRWSNRRPLGEIKDRVDRREGAGDNADQAHGGRSYGVCKIREFGCVICTEINSFSELRFFKICERVNLMLIGVNLLREGLDLPEVSSGNFGC